MMNLDFALYSITVLGLAGIIIFAFFYSSSLRNQLLLISFVITLMGSFLSIYTLLGNAVPVNPITSMMYRSIEKGEVLYFELHEKDEYILILLQIPEWKEPILVRYPWNKQTASKLEELRREIEAEERRNKNNQQSSQPGNSPESPAPDKVIVIDKPFDNSEDDRTPNIRHEMPTLRGPRKDYSL